MSRSNPFAAALFLLVLCGVAWGEPGTRPATAPAVAVVPTEMGLTLATMPQAFEPAAGSPAARAGFVAEDRVVAIDGRAVTDTSEFVAAVAARPPRATVSVTVVRDGREVVVAATLDEFAPVAATAPATAVPATGPADGKKALPRGRLGLPLRDVVAVGSVAPGGMGERAGLRRGDRVERINAEAVDSVEEAATMLANARYRGRAQVWVRRGGKTVEAILDLGAPVPYEVTREDDEEAAGHFTGLAELHKKIDADVTEGNGTAAYLLDDDFYSGTVAGVFQDVPKPGQAVVAISTPGDYVRDGGRFAGANVVWEDKGLVAGLGRGQRVYFRGALVKVVLKEGETRLGQMLLEGREVYATPGRAFNAMRPVFRAPTTAPAGTVKVSDVVAAVRSDAAGALARYRGKRMVFEGRAHLLMATGKGTYDIHFYPGERPGAHEDSVLLRVKGDLGGAVKGFKRGETLRFSGQVESAEVETQEVDNFLDGGKRKQTRVKLVFDLETMYLARTPL